MFFKRNRPQTLQITAFLITALIYIMLHASRTAWAYTKPTLTIYTKFDDSTLAWIDFSFLFAYALGLFLNGWLGDRIKLKQLLMQGMIASSFGLTAFAIFTSFTNISPLLLGVPLFLLNGFGQSTAFPGFMAILGNWFPSNKKGLVFGVWMASINIGNIAGQQIAHLILDILQLKWFSTFIVCSTLISLLNILMMRYLYVSPLEAGLAPFGGQHQNFKKLKENDSLPEVDDILGQVPTLPNDLPESQPRPIGFWEALKIPGLVLYAIVYTCTKLILYAILFWLPTHLRLDLGFYNEASALLACMEIGQLCGTVGIGYISDKLGNRSLAITGSLLFSVVTFYGLSLFKSSQNAIGFGILLFLGGLFVGGPAGLICGALSSDLGKSGKENVKATSTITGIIVGSGSFGSALFQPFIPLFRGYSFAVYTIFLLIGAILTPLASRQASGKKFGEVPYEKKDLELPQTDVIEVQP